MKNKLATPRDVGGFTVRLVEEQKEDLGRLLGVNREIHPVRGEGSPERKMCALLNGLGGAMLEFVRHLISSFATRDIRDFKKTG
jgi:hypothetical protein